MFHKLHDITEVIAMDIEMLLGAHQWAGCVQRLE